MKSEKVKKSVNGNGKEKGNFYASLPRFVDDQPIEVIGAHLPEVERRVPYGDHSLTLTISAARLLRPATDENGSQSLSRLPGDLERRLELVLRELAVNENINFNAGRNILCTGSRQLEEGMNRIDARQQACEVVSESEAVSEEEIHLVLTTLASLSFCLEYKKREFHFRSVEGFERVEEDDESFYKITLSPVFFSNKLFIERLFKD